MCHIHPKALSIPRDTVCSWTGTGSTSFRAGRAWLWLEELEEGDLEHGSAVLHCFSPLAAHLVYTGCSQVRVHPLISSRDLHCKGHLEMGYSHSVVTELPCLPLFLSPPPPLLPPPLSPPSPPPFFFFFFLLFWRGPPRRSREPPHVSTSCGEPLPSWFTALSSLHSSSSSLF